MLENSAAQEKRKIREVLEAERRKTQDLENQLTQQKEVGATRVPLEDLQPGLPGSPAVRGHAAAAAAPLREVANTCHSRADPR